jgi:hypothetical protein
LTQSGHGFSLNLWATIVSGRFVNSGIIYVSCVF